jgi:hypothetical protein
MDDPAIIALAKTELLKSRQCVPSACLTDPWCTGFAWSSSSSKEERAVTSAVSVADEIGFATIMFHRRHLFDHSEGLADEKCVADSNENLPTETGTSRDSCVSAPNRGGCLEMASIIHHGFHEILRPDEVPIQRHQQGPYRKMVPSGCRKRNRATTCPL